MEKWYMSAIQKSISLQKHQDEPITQGTSNGLFIGQQLGVGEGFSTFESVFVVLVTTERFYILYLLR